MEASLFLDTSSYIRIGLVDADLNWVGYKEIQNKKGSSLLHNEIFEFAQEYEISLPETKRIFLCSGPGSYTGMRLSEGMAQIFKWHNAEVFSYFHFEIPNLLGVEKGFYCQEAFKGEVFIHEWNGDESSQSLIKKEVFVEKPLNDLEYYHVDGVIYDHHISSTSELVHKNPQKVFSFVLDRGKHLETFYYRTAEKEFNKPKESLFK